jgi:Fe-S cluster assembly iron-binding protein IscA
MYEQSAVEKETLRCIVVPTPCEGIKLLLSLRELKEFDHMLEEADTELQSSCLLKLFNN